MSDPVAHAQGCTREGARRSIVFPSLGFCPSCKRMIPAEGTRCPYEDHLALEPFLDEARELERSAR